MPSTERPGVTRVVVTGELDIATSPRLVAALSRPADGTALVILDLSEMTFIDAVGLGVILTADRRLREADCRLVVIPGPRAVQRVFELTGTERELDFRATSDANDLSASINRTPRPAVRKSWGASRGRARVWQVGLFVVVLLGALPVLAGGALAAQAPVGLGTADSFALLAGSAVTNTGPSTVNGDLGVSPGTAVSGFPPGTVNCTVHAADAVAAQAQSDLTTAYNDAASRTPPVTVSGDLGGLTLTPGVYRSGSSVGLTGALTLDAGGDPNAVFIFQAGSTLTTATGSHVNHINGAQPCNVFWQIGSSATLGTSSVFVGNILAYTSISMNNAVTVDGRALARNGAVTLINDTITAARCSTTGGGTGGGGTGGGGGAGGTGGGTGGGPGGGPGSAAGRRNGTAVFTAVPRSIAQRVARFGTRRCVRPTFRVRVSGLSIRRVVFSLDSRIVATRTKSPFDALLVASGGTHNVTARVTFTDRTPVTTLHMRFRACAAAARRVQPQPPRAPGGFTG
ncbi:MAG: ice-binding family protein [Solirubrobacteraceae bacterium]